MENINDTDISKYRLTDQQVAIVKKLDNRFKIIGEFYEKNFNR